MRCLVLVLVAGLDLDERPVTKVINLLKDMQAQLIAEKKSDEGMYEKMACWCKNNGEGKGTAVEIAVKRIEQLENSIKALSSKASGLETSLEKLASEMAADQEALDSATAMRTKDREEFEETEQDLIVSIEGLKNALTVLEKQLSFLQVPSGESFLSVKHTVRRILNKGDDILAEILDAPSRSKLTEFVQGQTSMGSTDEIIGILQQMQENFEKNLKETQDSEATAISEYKALKEAKEAEIAAGEQQTKDKSALLGKTREELAAAKEDFEDTSDAMSADQAFLADLKKRCAKADSEWAERSKTRAAEIQAVTETITILNDDEAHDTFARTLGTFVQVRQRTKVTWHDLKAEALIQALYTAKQHVQLDSFKEVTNSINEMITDLKTEAKDEVDHKAYCQKSFQENEMEQMAVTNEIKDLDTKISDLASAIETAADEIAALKASLADADVEQMRASQNRVEENQEFQAVVADQRATQVVLNKAIDRMSDFYGNKAQLLQVSQEPGAAAPPPPAEMKEYKNNAGAGPVMTMLNNILTDAKELEAEAIKSEQDAQAAYEAFVARTNQMKAEAQKALANKSEEKARFESDKVAAETDKQDATDRSEALSKNKAELHKQCDFVLDNFTVRQEARAAEIESMQGALAALRTA